MAFQLQDVQHVSYSLFAQDADGNPASLSPGDILVVNSSDPAMATVTADLNSAPGTVGSGTITAGSKLGTVQINASLSHADGSPGATGAISIDIVAGPVATIAITLGTPA